MPRAGGVAAACDLALERANRPAAFRRRRASRTPAMVVGLGQQHLAVALGQRAGVDQLDRFVGKIKQTDRVRDVGPAAAEAASRGPALVMPQVVEQRRERPGLLDRARSSRTTFSISASSSDPACPARRRPAPGSSPRRRSRRRASGALRRPARSRSAHRPDDDRLKHPPLADRVRQRGERRTRRIACAADRGSRGSRSSGMSRSRPATASSPAVGGPAVRRSRLAPRAGHRSAGSRRLMALIARPPPRAARRHAR